MKFAYLIEPPFNFVDPSGNLTGSDVELAKITLASFSDQEFRGYEASFSQLIPGLLSGKWDISTGMIITNERLKLVNFTRPIWQLTDGLLVPAGNPKQIEGYGSFEENSKLRLGIVRDQNQQNTALSNGVRAFQIVIFDSYEEASNGVTSGKINAFASINQAHIGFIDFNSELELSSIEISHKEKPPEAGAFAVNPENAELLEEFNSFLEIYIGSPEHGQLMRSFGFTSREAT